MICSLHLFHILCLGSSKSHLDNLAYPKAHWMEVNQETRENVYWVRVGSFSLFTSGVEG